MSRTRRRTEPNSRTRALRAGVIALLVMVLGALGCGSRRGTTDPPAKVRLEKLFAYYQDYTRQHHKPPPNEQAFKDFLNNLPAEEKAIAHLDDVDSFLTSPGDGQKYVIQYGKVFDMSGATRAVAWEQTGVNGKRFVALSVGYVQACDEATFQSYKK